jgi:Domain of Unknown Function (DUF1206)
MSASGRFRSHRPGQGSSVRTHELGARDTAVGETAGALGRIGLLATAALYFIIAFLSFQIALEGRSGEHRPDSEGALELLAGQPLGSVLLVALAGGFAAHALWRVAQAFGDREREGQRPVGLAKRAGYAVIAVWYAGLAALTTRMLIGHEPNQPGEEDTAQGVLAWSFGRELVIAAGVAFITAAVVSVVFVVTHRHEQKLRAFAMTEATRRTASLLGTVGHLARGVVFAMIGAFLVVAAWTHEPEKTKGLDGALLQLAQAPLGGIALGAVAVGLAAFGGWCLAQARYRRT